MEHKPRIGIIGLGIMGSAMAHRLLQAGFLISVFNRTSAKADQLVIAGAVYCDTVAKLTGNSDVVITMVTDDKALRSVVLDSSGLLAVAREGQTLINMSTVSPAMTQEIEHACNDRHVNFVDAPVSGSKPQAESGQLIILASGDRDLVNMLEPVFSVLGSKTVYAGEAGKGTALKIVVNLILAHLAAALSEGLALAGSLGLDPELLLNTLAAAPALNAGYFQAKGKKILSGDLSPQFPLKHMLKDVQLVLATSDLPVTTAIAKMMESSVAEGHGDDDICSLGQL